ncbi:hypothetical protein ACRALDRAFT_1061684 [Sodiomyces alcalophilus JCM 7366]|uniref:uncharacterized protein n=1 Tax=Sodiomyces alcalophilus JCM 7366 TaxID=591952 RepID=UPI0039B3930B
MGNVPSVETTPSLCPASGPVVTSKPTKRQPQKLSKPRVGNHNASRNQNSTTAPSPSSSTAQLPTNANGSPLMAHRHSALLALSSSSPMHSPVSPSLASPPAAPGMDADHEAVAISQDQNIFSSLLRSKSTLGDRATKRRTWSLSLSGPTLKRANTMDCQVPGASLENPQPEDLPSPSIPPGDWDTAFHAPVRRRSILRTPGLATRAATEDFTSRRSSFRHSHPVAPVSPRSRCDSVDSASNRLLSLPPPCFNPRVQVDSVLTPSEAEYKQLGAMQFGSLRITNGTASPAPSTDGEVMGQDQTKDSTFRPRQVQSADHPDNQMKDLAIAMVQPEPPNGARPLSLPGGAMSEYGHAEYGHSNVWSESEGFSNERTGGSHEEARFGLLPADRDTVANPTDHLPGALSKADSGYSSATSLKSLRSKSNDKSNDTGTQDAHKTESTDVPPPTAEDGRILTGSAEWNSPGFTATEMTPSAAPSAHLQGSHASVTGHRESDFVPDPQGCGVSQTRKLRRKSAALPFDASHGRPGLPSSRFNKQRSPGAENPPTRNTEVSGSKKNRFQWFLSGAKADGPPAAESVAATSEAMVSGPGDPNSNYPGNGDRLSTIDRRAALREEAQPNTCEGPRVLRRRSLHSSSMAPKSPSLAPKPSIRRKPWSWGQKAKADAQQLAGGDWVNHSFESSVTSIDSISSSVGRSAFDQAFAAMPNQSGSELSPTKRSMTMPAHIERSVNVRRKPSASRSPFRYASSSRSPPIPEIPGMPPQNVSKAKTPPPVSLRRHSSKAFRLPPRPQTTPADPRHRTSDRPPSRAGSKGEVEPTPPVPPIPSKKLAQYAEFQRLRTASKPDHDAWRPNQPSRQNSVKNSPGATTTGRLRHAGVNRVAGLGPPAGLRQRASHDDGLVKDHRHDPPQSGHHPRSQTPTQSGSYYQNQLLQIERDSLGDAAWRQQRHYSRNGGRARHSRAGAQGSQGPYRILHSYNSPAYRNVPIWS